MNETTDAAAIFAPLWKRKWLILMVGLLVAAATYAYYKHKQPTYGASTEIYLGGNSEVQALLNGAAANTAETDRSISDQVVLINSSLVGEAVTRQLLHEHNLVAASGTAEASAATGSDFISIVSTARSGQAAADLANTYAQVYLKQRDASYRRNVQEALNTTAQQLRTARQGGSATSAQTLQVQDLVDRVNQLHSQLSLGDAGDEQLSRAVASAAPLNPKRNAIFGFALGVVLASFGAYALSRFDRRLRTLDDLEGAFQAPVLTALPSTRRPIGRVQGRPVLAKALREPLRRLHTTLQLRGVPNNGSNGRSAPRSVLFISAEAGDGKSTLIAGLALVQSEAGERVAIIEADLRRPVQAKLLGADGSQGLAEVLAGTLTVQQAMQSVQVASAEGGVDTIDHPAQAMQSDESTPAVGGATTAVEQQERTPQRTQPTLAEVLAQQHNGQQTTQRAQATPTEGGADTVVDHPEQPVAAVRPREAGSVSVLSGGRVATNPQALLAERTMATVLHSVADAFDYVLIDAPPPLAVSDVLPLLNMADAIVIVARVGDTNERSAQRLVDLLAQAPHAPVIGIVANDLSSAQIEAFGFSDAYYGGRR